MCVSWASDLLAWLSHGSEADNTVRESKNQWMFKYLCTHLLDNRLKCVVQIHMRVGHTHDKLGHNLRLLKVRAKTSMHTHTLGQGR